MKLKLSLLFLVLAAAVIVLTFNWQKLRGGASDSDGTDAQNQQNQLEITRVTLVTLFAANDMRDYAGLKVKIDLAKLTNDKNVFIHLWASWCSPCLNEIPELVAYAHKNSKATQFILVSLDNNAEDLSKFLKSFPELAESNFIRVWDKDSVIAKSFNADRLPMTVMIEQRFAKIKPVRSVVDWKTVPGI